MSPIYYSVLIFQFKKLWKKHRWYIFKNCFEILEKKQNFSYSPEICYAHMGNSIRNSLNKNHWQKV
jgi:hypothetical protein